MVLSKVSAIIIGTNNINLDNTTNIVAAAGRCPVLAYTDNPVKKGALVGYVPDDGKRGRMLAATVYDVLVKNTPIHEIPVKTDPSPRFLLNARTAERLELELAYEILRFAEILE